MASARTLHVRCTTWEQVEVFHTRKLRRGKLLSMKVPFHSAPGSEVTLNLELPNQVVIVIEGKVLKSSPVEPDPKATKPETGKTWLEVELAGFTEEVIARIRRMAAGDEPDPEPEIVSEEPAPPLAHGDDAFYPRDAARDSARDSARDAGRDGANGPASPGRDLPFGDGDDAFYPRDATTGGGKPSALPNHADDPFYPRGGVNGRAPQSPYGGLASPAQRGGNALLIDFLPADERVLFQHLTGELRRLRSVAVHEVLGVDRDADADEIRRGWMDLVRRHHPDLVARRNAPAITHLAEELTILANRAYDRLRV
ncbi:MAG: J domain-containing protein, partial [Myxococcales bacterium]|nr:J domain-containing protein [Myxococcales bacterium]